MSSVVHLLYGFYIFSTAVAWDLSQTLAVGFSSGNVVDIKTSVVADESKNSTSVPLDGSVPPIVLVHGIFGFGKGVRFFLFSFA